LRKTIQIIILASILVSCSINNGIIKRINFEFKSKYPKIEKFSRTKYQEKLRKRIILKFLSDFKLENSKLYIIESFQNRGGHHVITKYQTVMTYFFQNGELLEVYSINNDNKLERKKDQYWGTEYMASTINFIQKRFELNQLDSIGKMSESREQQINHAGEFFVTELDEDLNIIKVVKCEEFRFE